LHKASVAANELAQFAITEPSDVGFVKQSLTLPKPSDAATCLHVAISEAQQRALRSSATLPKPSDAPQSSQRHFSTSTFIVDFLSIKSSTKVGLFASKQSKIKNRKN